MKRAQKMTPTDDELVALKSSQAGRDFLARAAQAIEDVSTLFPELRGNGWTGPRLPFIDVVEVATSMMFIEHGPVKRLHAPGNKWSSYGAKHAAEKWGRALGFASYVSNGSFLVACIACNVPHKRCGPTSPNSFVALKLLEGYALRISE